jgi:hypothetical protein
MNSSQKYQTWNSGSCFLWKVDGSILSSRPFTFRSRISLKKYFTQTSHTTHINDSRGESNYLFMPERDLRILLETLRIGHNEACDSKWKNVPRSVKIKVHWNFIDTICDMITWLHYLIHLVQYDYRSLIPLQNFNHDW